MTTDPPPAETEPIGRGHRVLGRYEVIGELARGGMGTVYLARHAGEGRFQRLFAIKVLHPHLAEEVAFVDMMRDEARIAARIHHPNVVSIVDLGSQGDLHYVVMEYVEGPSFATLLKRSREKRPVDLVVAVVIDSLEGLHAAHTLKDDDGEEIRLVHRDVSPPNILVGADGIGRITDFGIAKAEARISSTRPGIRKGKLQFMSPEQIKESDDVDQRTDVWAAGAVLWNALTGRSLFKGDNDAATLHNILEKDVTPPSTEGLKPPVCFDEIILRALARAPSDRFTTALEMADELRLIAAANGLAGSKHRVARWVTDTFGEELDRRRKAIREVAQRRDEQHEQTDASQVNVLPPINAGMITGSLTAAPLSITHLSHIPSFSIEPSSTGSVLPAPPPGISRSEPPEFRQRKTRFWVAVAVAGVAFITFMVLASRSPDESSNADSSRDLRPAASSESPVPAAEQTAGVEARPAPTMGSEADQGAGAHTRAGDDKKELGRNLPRRGPVHSAPAAKDPLIEPRREPREPTAPAQKSMPVPAPTDEFEKNPYLRR